MIDLFSPDLTEEQLAAYVKEKDAELEQHTAGRLYGIPTRTGKGYRRAGYQILRDFYEGDQWLYTKEDGGTMRVYNYCFTTVHNYSAFLTNEPVDIDIDTDPLNEEQVTLASITEDVLTKILDSNKFAHHFEGGALNGSLLGDTFIIGPFWDPKRKKIWFQNMRQPEFVRIIWADTNYYEMLGYVLHWRISVERAKSMYGDLAAARGITIDSNKDTGLVMASSTVSGKKGRGSGPGGNQEEPGKFVTIRQGWFENHSILLINDKVIDFQKHDWGFVPGTFIPNIMHPWDSHGISDVENMLDPQVEYNEANSDVRDILRQTTFDTIFGKNLQINDMRSGAFQLVDIGDEGEIIPDPRRTATQFVAAYGKDRQNDVFNISGIPEVIFGGPRVREATGRALSVLMQGVNNRVKSRQNRWQPELIKFANNILRLVELYVPKGSSIIPDDYDINVFFPSILVRDVVDEINKFNSKLQSLTTTQKNIGIGNPRQEQDLMKKEYSDQELMLEITKQPQLHIQLQEMIKQELDQREAGNPIEPEVSNPALQEGENQGGKIPLAKGSSVQSPVSRRGAVRQAAQNAGSVTAR